MELFQERGECTVEQIAVAGHTDSDHLWKFKDLCLLFARCVYGPGCGDKDTEAE